MSAEAKIKKVTFPLWAKLAFFTGLLAIAATAAVGIVLTDISARTLKASSRDYRLAIADDVAQTLKVALTQSRVDLMTSADILSQRGVSEDARVEWLLAFVTASTTLDHLVVYDAAGRRIDALSQDDVTVDTTAVLSDDLLRKLRTKRGTVIGNVTSSEQGSRVEVFTAVRPASGPPTGFVGTRARLDPVAARVARLTAERLEGDGARLAVLDQSLRVIAGPGDQVGKKLIEHPMLSSPQTLMNQRIAQSGEIVSDGVPVIASVLPLHDLRWFIIVEVPREVAYASLSRMRRGIWLAVLVVVLVALLGSAFGARRIAGPLQLLTEFARKLAERRFDERVQVDTADEVGVLADVMNDTAQQLSDSEEAIKRETAIRTDLGRYLPRELVDAVVRRDQDLELGGMRAPITILFADVVRFTPMCESMEPEQVVSLLNEFFTIVTEIVFRYGGTVDKFVGDSVMAFWGAPSTCDDHADRAIRCAEDILRWLEVGNEDWRESYGVELEVAIGINTGEPIVGNVGSTTRMEYTVIGAPVNTAARLEALARPGQILTTITTKEASEDFAFARVGEELVNEGAEAIEIWEVLL